MARASLGGDAKPTATGNPSSVVAWVLRRYKLPDTGQWVLEVQCRGGRTINDVYVPSASDGMYSGTRKKLPRKGVAGYVIFAENDRNARIALWGGSIDLNFRGIQVNDAHDGHFTVEPSGWATAHVESETEFEESKIKSVGSASSLTPSSVKFGVKEIPEEKVKPGPAYSVSTTMWPTGDRLTYGTLGEELTLTTLKQDKYQYKFKARRTTIQEPDRVIPRELPDPYLHPLWEGKSFWHLNAVESGRAWRVDLQKSNTHKRVLESFDDEGKKKKYETTIPVGEAHIQILRPEGFKAKSSEFEMLLYAWEQSDDSATPKRYLFEKTHTELVSISRREFVAGFEYAEGTSVIGTQVPDAYIALEEKVKPKPGALAKRTQEVFAYVGDTVPVLFFEQYNLEGAIEYNQKLFVDHKLWNQIEVTKGKYFCRVTDFVSKNKPPIRAVINVNDQTGHLGGSSANVTIEKDAHIERSLYGKGKIHFPLLRTTAKIDKMKGPGSPPTALLLGANPTDRVVTLGALQAELAKLKAEVAKLAKKSDVSAEFAKVSAATFGLYQPGSIGTGSYTIGSALGSEDVYCSPASSSGSSKVDVDPPALDPA